MGNRTWLALLTVCSLTACGGSARTTRELDASTDGAGAAGATKPPEGGTDVAGGGGAGRDSGAVGNARTVHLGPGSWDVRGKVSSQPHASRLCTAFDFALTVDGSTMTIGNGGRLTTAPVQIIDGAYVATSVDFGQCGSNSIARFFAKDLRLQGVDSDGDGEADQLEATVTLEATDEASDGTGGTVEVIPTVVLTAAPDQSNPTLSVWGVWTNLSPLDGITLHASEPLDSASALTLTGTSSIPLPALVEDPMLPHVAIAFGSSRILPLGDTWQISGVGRDLAGNSLKFDPGATLSTLADPGVQAQDGFEAPLSGVSGTAQRVANRGNIPALSGEQSLWLDYAFNASRTIHLQRSANQKNLHFVARAFNYPKEGVYTEKILRAGVVGGVHVVTLTRTTPAGNPISASGDEQMPWVSDVMQFDAVLDEPGTDVVLEISDTVCALEGPCARQAGWMIDDLTID